MSLLLVMNEVKVKRNETEMEKDYSLDPERAQLEREEQAGRRRDEDSDSSTAADGEGAPTSVEECQRTCRRKFWTELVAGIAKIAGVILAALGVSSFTTED